MKHLLIPFLALALCPPASAEWVDAATRPELQRLWTTPAPLPFQPTPQAFKNYLNRVSGLKILQVQGCRFTSKNAQFYSPKNSQLLAQRPIKDRSWIYAYKEYTCEQVFFEHSDPRGRQRCMGKFWSYSRGSAPNFTAKLNWGHRALKNECRWM